MAERLRLEVVYALADRQWLVALELASSSTVSDAILASGLMTELGLTDPVDAGIHGRRVSADTPLRHGDRVELYRGLHFDPMESRRRRAAKSQRAR